MIKNLLNADEDPPPGTKVIVEETILNPPAEPQNTEPPKPEQPPAENLETRPVFEIPEDAEFFLKPGESAAAQTPQVSENSSIAEPFSETSHEEFVNLETPEFEAETPVAESSADEKTNYEASGTIFQSEVKPQSAGETIRQSGMAYSAAIVLFGSVVFMMILGWFADLLLGSSPWGIVGGIFLGGIIGFIQFFRITSQIFKK